MSDFNLVGPPGLEPGTKGFACSEGFPRRGLSLHPQLVLVGCGTL